MEYIQYVDMQILKYIHNTSNVVLDKVMLCITSLGNGGNIWIIIIVILLLNKKYRRVGILAAFSLALVTLFGEVLLKNIVQRPRPFVELRYIKLLVGKPTSYSFPSGHTASSFATAYIIGRRLKPLKIPAYTLATFIAYSRMYLFLHYPTDIIGGIVLGVLTGSLILHIDGKISYSK